MNNDSKISPFGLSIMSTFLYRSFYVLGLLNLIISIAMEDTIISIIIGSIISLIFLFSYLYLNNTLKNLNIFEKINTTFPRIISCFFIVLLIICSTIIASFTLYNLSLFINYNLLNDINIVPISILLILCITYLSCKGINAVIRCSGILIFIWLFLVIISLLTLINYSNPLNLYPFFINKETSIITSSIYYSLYTIMPLFMLLIIPKEKVENNHKLNKYMITFYIINAIYLLLNTILIISILGYKFSRVLNYPEIIVLQKVSLLNFIERIEDLLSFKLMFDSFILLSVIIIYIKEGIIATFRINNNHKLILLISLIIIIISFYLHITNIKRLLPFILIILIIHLLLLIFIKNKR